jgi:hypothetical protein
MVPIIGTDLLGSTAHEVGQGSHWQLRGHLLGVQCCIRRAAAVFVCEHHCLGDLPNEVLPQSAHLQKAVLPVYLNYVKPSAASINRACSCRLRCALMMLRALSACMLMMTATHILAGKDEHQRKA